MPHKISYRENSEMTKFMMISEPDLIRLYIQNYKASVVEILTPSTLICLINILQVFPSEMSFKKSYSENSKVEEDMTTKFADSIKVRRKHKLNKRRKVFMNSQRIQHRGDKVIFFHVAFELKLIG
jgi:hypothetical protein